MSDKFDELDVRGLSCPLPLLRARAKLAGMESGQILQVLATDPDAANDFRAYCEQSGHRLVAVESAGEVTILRIAKK